MSIDAINIKIGQSNFDITTSEVTEPNEKAITTQTAHPHNIVAKQQIKKKIGSESTNEEAILADIQDLSKSMNSKIQFKMDYDENEMVASIIDRDTKEVIKQLPSEELRKLHKKLKETAEMMGLIVDTTA